MTRMSQSQILRTLGDMSDIVTEMADDAAVVPKEFKKKVRTVEDDLWDLDIRESFPGAKKTRDTFSTPDIFRAVATLGGLPHVHIANGLSQKDTVKERDATRIAMMKGVLELQDVELF